MWGEEMEAEWDFVVEELKVQQEDLENIGTNREQTKRKRKVEKLREREGEGEIGAMTKKLKKWKGGEEGG